MESSNLPDQKTADVEEVRNLAYRFWQERGCPTGTSKEDWFRAGAGTGVCRREPGIKPGIRGIYHRRSVQAPQTRSHRLARWLSGELRARDDAGDGGSRSPAGCLGWNRLCDRLPPNFTRLR